MAFAQTLDRYAGQAWNDIKDNTGISNIDQGIQNEDLDSILAGVRKLGSGPRDTSPREDPLRDMFVATNTSYSGTDVVPMVQIKGTLITLGNVQTISISTFREKEPVRVLGKSYVKGYTAGPRTIAGSITFTLFDRDPFWDILKLLKEEVKTTTDRYHTPLGDQIPAINIILWFSNEYGRKSVQTLYGVEFSQEGQVHSVNDIYSEKTVNYVALDMDIMLDHKDVASFRNLMYERQLTGQFTDNYLQSLLEYKRNIELQIQNVDTQIQAINIERGRRGIVTFGLSNLIGAKPMKDHLQTLVTKKSYLVGELVNVSNLISDWSNVVYDSTAYFGGDGTALRTGDSLRKAPTATPSSVRYQPNSTAIESPNTGNVDFFPPPDAPGNVTVEGVPSTKEYNVWKQQQEASATVDNILSTYETDLYNEITK